MSEIQRIEDQLERAFHGGAWHGPAVLEILEGIQARQAAARPLAGGHSIWEIVEHIAVWENVTRRRLAGDVVEPTPEEDWPAVQETTAAAWQKMLERLKSGHAALEKAVGAVSDARLGEVVPGKEYSVYIMLHGVVQHGLYHAGQVALLKKAASR